MLLVQAIRPVERAEAIEMLNCRSGTPISVDADLCLHVSMTVSTAFEPASKTNLDLWRDLKSIRHVYQSASGQLVILRWVPRFSACHPTAVWRWPRPAQGGVLPGVFWYSGDTSLISTMDCHPTNGVSSVHHSPTSTGGNSGMRPSNLAAPQACYATCCILLTKSRPDVGGGKRLPSSL